MSVVCVSYVTDSVCAVTISMALFILPSRKPNYLCFRTPNGSFFLKQSTIVVLYNYVVST